MTDAVVVIDDAIGQAYRKGYRTFEDIDCANNSRARESVDHFKESAKWANIIAPELRQLSGASDSGAGTFQRHRDVVVVYDDNLLGPVIEGSDNHSQLLYQILVDAFDRGANDALRGEEPDADSAIDEFG